MKKNQSKLIPKLLIFTLFLTSTIWIGCESKKNSEDTVPNLITEEVSTKDLTINTEAIDLLEKSLDNLSGMTNFSVQTQGTYEDLFDYGYRVNYETSGNITVHRPNKMRIDRYGLEMHQIFYFDGESLTLHNPYENVYATEPLAGNIENMLHIVRDVYGFSGPSADLVYNNSFSLLSNGINYAELVGKELIEDEMCNHLIFAKPDVSFQIWVSENEPYLPYKYVVTDTSTPQLLSFGITMRDWNTSPDIQDALFQFALPKDATEIAFLKVDQDN